MCYWQTVSSLLSIVSVFIPFAGQLVMYLVLMHATIIKKVLNIFVTMSRFALDDREMSHIIAHCRKNLEKRNYEHNKKYALDHSPVVPGTLVVKVELLLTIYVKFMTLVCGMIENEMSLRILA